MKFLIIFHNFVVFSRTLKPREIPDEAELLLPDVSFTTEATTTSSITTFTGQATVTELQPFEISANNKNCNESEFRTKPHFGNFMFTSEPPSLCASAEPPTQSTPVKEFHRTMTEPLPSWATRPWNKPPSVDNFTSPCYFYRDGEENPLPCNFFPPDFPDYFTDYYNDFPVMTPPNFMIQPCQIFQDGDFIEVPCRHPGANFPMNFGQFSQNVPSNFDFVWPWPPENDSVIIEHYPPIRQWGALPNFPGVNVLGPVTWDPPLEISLAQVTEDTWIRDTLPTMEPSIESTTEVKSTTESTTEVKYNETLIEANFGNNSTPIESSNSTLDANGGPTILTNPVSTENQHLATQPLGTNKGAKPKFSPKFILCVLIIYFR